MDGLKEYVYGVVQIFALAVAGTIAVALITVMLIIAVAYLMGVA